MPWDKPYHPPKNQRLDPLEYTYSYRVYFMTIRAYMDKTLFVRDDLNELVINVLRDEQSRQNCSVYTYCLMPDHLHFLISPRQDGISALTLTDRYKGKATNASWTVRRRGKLWQTRHFDHIVRTEESLTAISDYILTNPVRKGLVERPEDWKWSGLMNPLPL